MSKQGSSFNVKIFFNGTSIGRVYEFAIRQWSFDYHFLPKIEILLEDYGSGLLISESLIHEGSVFELEISHIDQQVKNIRLPFTILAFSAGTENTDGFDRPIKIYGLLTTNLFATSDSSSMSGISSDIMSKYFGTKPIQTNDHMSWKKYTETDYSFINNVLQKSYISEFDIPLLSFDCYTSKFEYKSLKDISNSKATPILISTLKTKEIISNNDYSQLVAPTYIFTNISGINSTSGFGSNELVLTNGFLSEKILASSKPFFGEIKERSKQVAKTKSAYYGYNSDQFLDVHKNYYKASLLRNQILGSIASKCIQISLPFNLDKIKLSKKYNISIDSVRSKTTKRDNDLAKGDWISVGLTIAYSDWSISTALILCRDGINYNVSKELNNALLKELH